MRARHVVLAVLFTVAAACGDDDTTTARGSATPTTAAAEMVIDPGDGGRYEPDIDPAAFVDGVDNPFFPLTPGTRWVYEGEDEGEVEHVEVVVLDERKDIMGISAVVVRDTVSIDGEVVEDTFDWFAQDRDGNVWYLGEASQEIEDGEVVSTEGSWEAGVDGALPGIIMPGAPEVGFAYRQEFYEGEAEDLGEILEVTADRVVTRDWNPLEPEVIEEKTYERGVGLVGERHTSGEPSSIELVSFTPG